MSLVAGWRPSSHLVRMSAEKTSMTSHRDHSLLRRFPTNVFIFFVLGIVRMIKCPKALVLKLMGTRLLLNFVLLMTFNWDLGDLSGCTAHLQSDPGVNISILWGCASRLRVCFVFHLFSVFCASTQLMTPVSSCGAVTTTTHFTAKPRRVLRLTGQSALQAG